MVGASATTLGQEIKYLETLKGVRQPPNPFRVGADLGLLTQGSRKLEPWAEISQRLRRFFQAEPVPILAYSHELLSAASRIVFTQGVNEATCEIT